MGRKKNRKRNKEKYTLKEEKETKVWKQVKKFLPCHSGTVKVFEDPTSGMSIYGGGYLRELEIYFGHMIVDVGADIEVECINIKNARYPELEAYNNPIVQIDWEDFGAVSLPKDFWETLVALIRKEKRNVTVCCQGGHGRTGTVLSILAHFMGVGGENPVQYVRDNYCYRAVESWSQLRYVAFITGTKAEEDIPNSAFVWEWEKMEADAGNRPNWDKTEEDDPDNNPLKEGESAVGPPDGELTKLNHWLESKERGSAGTGTSSRTGNICAHEDIERDSTDGFEKVTTASGATVYVKPADADVDIAKDTPATTYANGKFLNRCNNSGVLVTKAGDEVKELLTPKKEKELEELDGNRKSDNPLENLREEDKEELKPSYNNKAYERWKKKPYAV